MKITKKILSLALACTMIFSVFSISTYGAEETEKKSNKAYGFYQHIMMSDEMEFSEKRTVSRAEYAKLLVNLLRIDYEKPEEPKSTFQDVTAEEAYINEINAVTKLGYMSGISEKLFAPDQKMTLIQAEKTILDLMGYKTLIALGGGFPEGYRKYAQELGLTKGITTGINDFLTQGDLAKLVYNALDAKTLNLDVDSEKQSMSTDSENTFMTKVLKMDRIEGILTDNGITGLYQQSEITKDYILVDQKRIKLNEKTEYVRDELGRDLICYVTDDEDDPELIYAALSEKDERYSFDIDDFEEYTASSISYSSGKKTVKKSLADNAVMIYNGMAKASYDGKDFEFETGSVDLIVRDSKICMIAVHKLDYMHIASIDYENEEFYGSLLDESRRADSISKEDYDFFDIYSADGSKKGFSDLLKGNVAVIEANAPAAKLTIYEEKVDNFQIKSIDRDDGKIIISNGSQEYRVLERFDNSPYAAKLEINKTYTIWTAGSIAVWLETAGDAANVGYLIKCTFDEDNEQYLAKVYDATTGQVVSYPLKDRVTILDQDEKQDRYRDSAAYGIYLSDYQGIMKFKLNSDGNITYVELPTQNKAANGQLHELFDRRKLDTPWTGDGGYQGIWFYNQSTVFVSIPSDRNDIGHYENLTYAAGTGKYKRNNQTVSVAYTSKPNSAIAEYVLHLETTVEAAVCGTEKTFVVVDKISETLGEDDEIVQKIVGTKVNTSLTERVEIYSKMDAVRESDGSTHSAFEYITDTLQSTENGVKKRYNVQTGDIIRVVYNDRNYATIADLTWRADMDNPTSSHGKKGWLVGSNGYHIAGETNGNPFGLHANGALAPYHDLFDGAQNLRIVYGSVLKVEDGNIIQMTTADLTDPSVNVTQIGSNFATYNINFESGRLIVANYDGKKVTSQLATINDIKSYEEVGTECSRILIGSHWGVYNIAVIINGGDY